MLYTIVNEYARKEWKGKEESKGKRSEERKGREG
jgi:hypothetical protein